MWNVSIFDFLSSASCALYNGQDLHMSVCCYILKHFVNSGGPIISEFLNYYLPPYFDCYGKLRFCCIFLGSCHCIFALLSRYDIVIVRCYGSYVHLLVKKL